MHAKTENGLIEGSVKRLDEFYNHLEEFYNSESIKALAVALPSLLFPKESLSKRFQDALKTSFNDWLKTICEPLAKGA